MWPLKVAVLDGCSWKGYTPRALSDRFFIEPHP
jgi:hypothetical protein